MRSELLSVSKVFIWLFRVTVGRRCWCRSDSERYSRPFLLTQRHIEIWTDGFQTGSTELGWKANERHLYGRHVWCHMTWPPMEDRVFIHRMTSLRCHTHWGNYGTNKWNNNIYTCPLLGRGWTIFRISLRLRFITPHVPFFPFLWEGVNYPSKIPQTKRCNNLFTTSGHGNMLTHTNHHNFHSKSTNAEHHTKQNTTTDYCSTIGRSTTTLEQE